VDLGFRILSEGIMILLTTTSSVIQIVTGEAVNSINVQASFIDVATSIIGGNPSYANTLITTATTTTVVPSPASSTQRALKNLDVYNSSVASCQVTIQHTDGTTTVDLFNYTLLTGESIHFAEGRGWYVYDANGNLKEVMSFPGAVIGPTGPQGSTGATGVTGPTGANVVQRVVRENANYNAVAGDFVLCDTSGGPFTVTLPLSSGVQSGQTVTVKKITTDTNAVTIACSGSDTLDNNASMSTAVYNTAVEQATDGLSAWSIY